MGQKLQGITAIFFVLTVISGIGCFLLEGTWFGISVLSFCVFLFLLLIFGMIGTSVEQEKYLQAEYKRKRHICNNCGYEWMSKKTVGSPSKCPHCNSKNIKRFADNCCSNHNAKVKSNN